MHERLLGRRTLACLRQLERTQWLGTSALAELQYRKLQRLLSHAYRHCPFHRRRMDRAGILPATMHSLADLRALPLLTKAMIQRHTNELTWTHVPGGARRYTTGGSTGDPLIFYLDRRRQGYDQAARMRSHRWFGAGVGEPEVYLWGSPIELSRQNRVRSFRDRLINNIMLDAFDMNPSRMNAYLREIERTDPISLFGYPSSLALLARHANKAGRTIHLPRLRAVFATGETLTDDDRTEIQSAFPVPVANGYGSREGGFIAHECPQGRMHVTDESVIVEIVDDDDAPVQPGRLGRLVITHLDNFAMPFIRYDTGDMARRPENETSCPCGRNLSTLQSIEGRRTDFLVSADGTVRHALSAIYVLRELPGIERYRIVQAPDCSLTVQLVCTDGLTSAMRESILRSLQPLVGPHTPVCLEEVDSIDPTASGKYRPVVSAAKASPVLAH